MDTDRYREIMAKVDEPSKFNPFGKKPKSSNYHWLYKKYNEALDHIDAQAKEIQELKIECDGMMNLIDVQHDKLQSND